MSLIVDSAALLLAKSAFLGLRVCALLAIAKYGAPDDLALISFAVAMAELGRLFADFGTDTWSIRSLVMARNAEEKSKILAAAATIKLCGSVVVAPALVAACVVSFSNAGYVPGLLAGVLMLTSQFAGWVAAFFQAEDRIGALCTRIVPPTLIAVLLIVLTAAQADHAIQTLVILGATETVIAGLSIALLRAQHRLPPIRQWSEHVRPALSKSAPLAAFGMVVGLYCRLDTIVLAQVSLASLATYTVAQRLCQPFQTAATTFGAVVYRRIASDINAHRPFMRRLVAKDLPVIFVCVLLGAVALWHAGKIIIGSILPEYASALVPLAILCATSIPLAINAALAGVLLAFGYSSVVLGIAMLDLLTVAVAMLVLVPTYGATGAALALLIGAAVNGVAQSTCVWVKTRKYLPQQVAETTPHLP